MTTLHQEIEGLNPVQVADALRNLRNTLEYDDKAAVSDADVAQELGDLRLEGATGELRDAILSDSTSPDDIERWGRSFLLFAAAEPSLSEQVGEAVADARESTGKDFGLTGLIVMGVIVVLLKWRPQKVSVTKEGVEVTWTENDVSVVGDLVTAAMGP